jgi:hypothetical protein
VFQSNTFWCFIDFEKAQKGDFAARSASLNTLTHSESAQKAYFESVFTKNMKTKNYVILRKNFFLHGLMLHENFFMSTFYWGFHFL